MKRKNWRNLAGTVMWFFAGMALWGYALTLMERREERGTSLLSPMTSDVTR